MPLRKIILIIYMWVYKFFQDHIMRDVDISKKTVVDWFSRIVGPEKTVEIDESLFNKSKHNKGKKSVCQQWVFSGAEQGSRVILCQITTRSKMMVFGLSWKWLNIIWDHPKDPYVKGNFLKNFGLGVIGGQSLVFDQSVSSYECYLISYMKHNTNSSHGVLHSVFYTDSNDPWLDWIVKNFSWLYLVKSR
ncbi:Elongation factor 4 [Frankliniella fusca]|uniref:Elongation factor 4 n=2 Tax=Frankliniella fusca TaxID=407009 RepID=A0AAE1LG03_9NEOP|nr:Elongation factor 4 [Frankliniella fusca]